MLVIRMFLFAVSLSIDLATISRAFPDHALSRFPMAFAAVEPFVFIPQQFCVYGMDLA